MENPEIETARQIIEFTGTSLFLTGRAGTGKTTFLRRLRNASPKRMVVLAPTGIAAINAGGVTLHSFFQLPFAPFVPGTSNFNKEKRYAMSKQKLKLIRSLDLLVIDEISMVRADLLDAVDDALKRYRHNGKPFGGVQLLLIGDLQQLAPVVKDEEWNMLSPYYETPYFFSSRALRQTNYTTVELLTVYRQTDEAFLALLNGVREGHATADVLAKLNKRYVPNYRPTPDDGTIQLVTHNWQAHQINESELRALAGDAFIYKAKIKGKFPELSYPTNETLELKKGAQVMFVKNDADKRYFNGMIGHITFISEKGFRVRPDKKDAAEIDVAVESWENTRYALNEKTQEIEEVVEGTFQQFPVKLAWAITIHKSQGLTFDRVVINAAGAFAHGQTYVALSRCRTLEGITLTSPIPPSAVIADSHVEAFNADMRAHRVDDAKLLDLKNSYGVSLLTDLYTFHRETYGLETINRVFQEFLYNVYSETARGLQSYVEAYKKAVPDVAMKFQYQYWQMLTECQADFTSPELQTRLQKGATYFREKLLDVQQLLPRLDVEIGNAAAARRMSTAKDDLVKDLDVHIRLLEHVARHGFSVKSYLDQRAKCVLEAESGKIKNVKENGEATAHAQVPSEIVRPELYNRLRAWRKQKMGKEQVGASSVISNNAMLSLANLAPDTLAALMRVPYFGAKSMNRYGNEIIELILRYKSDVKEGRVQEPAEAQPVQSEKELRKQERAAAAPQKKTWEESYDLYKSGRSIAEICELRSLKRSTIVSHLLRYAADEAVRIEDFVGAENLALLRQYFSTHPIDNIDTITPIYQALNEKVPYDDIRTMLTFYRKRSAGK